MEPTELQPSCECGVCDGVLLPLEAWAVAGGAGVGKGPNGTNLFACAPSHCLVWGSVLEEHGAWRVCCASRVVTFTLPSTGVCWHWPVASSDEDALDALCEVLDRAGISYKVARCD